MLSSLTELAGFYRDIEVAKHTAKEEAKDGRAAPTANPATVPDQSAVNREPLSGPRPGRISVGGLEMDTTILAITGLVLVVLYLRGS